MNGGKVSFETTLTGIGNNTGIEVSEAHILQLDGGKRPAVLVDLNGYEYRNTVAVMGGTYMISVSAAVRTATGLRAGDPIKVTLTRDSTPRTVDLPVDFAAALDARPAARAFFDALANSIRRFHVDNINATKNPETRQRRIDAAVQKFLDGKQR